MVRSLAFIVLSAVLVCVITSATCADPVKWSAPMDHYPSPWAPTAAPPNYYNNPWGYYYPYYPGYGNTQYGVYPGYGSQYGYSGRAYQGYYPGYSGNPYHSNYPGQQGYQ